MNIINEEGREIYSRSVEAKNADVVRFQDIREMFGDGPFEFERGGQNGVDFQPPRHFSIFVCPASGQYQFYNWYGRHTVHVEKGDRLRVYGL